jgi:hypothetical protein
MRHVALFCRVVLGYQVDIVAFGGNDYKSGDDAAAIDSDVVARDSRGEYYTATMIEQGSPGKGYTLQFAGADKSTECVTA